MPIKGIFLSALSAAAIIAAFFVDPISQDPAYHEFADTRSLLGVPNFWNVASNVPFLLVGGAGLYYLSRKSLPGILSGMFAAYCAFFAGIFLTGIGSAYYHISPANHTLVWDRLPMTLGFMGLTTIVIGEHISMPTARRLLLPLLIAGAASVFYWGVTEACGQGDLRPYALVQFLPMLLIPLILLMYRTVFDRAGFFWIVMALYALSKVCEYLDSDIYAIGELISGHSLKHLVAATASLILLHGIDTRRAGSKSAI